MIDKMSNASRLVEKLKQKGMLERRACPSDRRQVEVLLTEKGRKVLEVASQAISAANRDTFSNLTVEEAKSLNCLLDKIRTCS